MPGDKIIVDPEIGCENGDLCVVKYTDEVTFKRVKFENGNIILRPLNPKFPDITIRRDSEVDFQVIGRVVDMVPSFDFK
jgi:SOS-response transcriptional repressor LexA